MKVCGPPGGAHEEYSPVSSAPRTTRYFSAPGLSVGVRGSDPGAAAGGGAPRAGPWPYPYTPGRSGLPSAVLGAGCLVRSAPAVSAVATGFVPATVTVAVRVTVPFVPVTVSV